MQKHEQQLPLGSGIIWKRKLRAGLQFLCFLYFRIPFLCNKSGLLTQFKAIGFDLRKMDIGEQANAL